MADTSSPFESEFSDRTPNLRSSALRLLREQDFKSALRHGALSVLFLGVAGALSSTLTGVASAAQPVAGSNATPTPPTAVVEAPAADPLIPISLVILVPIFLLPPTKGFSHILHIYDSL